MFRNSRNEKTSTGAMREVAALLGRLRQYQLVYLETKRKDIEALVAQTGGMEQPEAQQDVSFNDFWDS